MTTSSPQCARVHEYDMATQYSLSSDQSFLEAIVQSISILADEQPTDIEALGDYVDVDALEMLVTPTDDRLPELDGHVTFCYMHYHVTIETGTPLTIGIVEE